MESVQPGRSAAPAVKPSVPEIGMPEIVHRVADETIARKRESVAEPAREAGAVVRGLAEEPKALDQLAAPGSAQLYRSDEPGSGPEAPEKVHSSVDEPTVRVRVNAAQIHRSDMAGAVPTTSDMVHRAVEPSTAPEHASAVERSPGHPTDAAGAMAAVPESIQRKAESLSADEGAGGAMLVRQDASPDLVSAAPSVVYREADPSSSDEFPSRVSTGHSHSDTDAVATVHRDVISPIPAQLPAASLSPAVQPTVAPTVATPAGIVHRKARTGASPHASDSAVSGLPVPNPAGSRRLAGHTALPRTRLPRWYIATSRRPKRAGRFQRKSFTEKPILRRATHRAGSPAANSRTLSDPQSLLSPLRLLCPPRPLISSIAQPNTRLRPLRQRLQMPKLANEDRAAAPCPPLTTTYPLMTHALVARSPGLPRAGYDMIFREAIENGHPAPSAPFEGFSKAARRSRDRSSPERFRLRPWRFPAPVRIQRDPPAAAPRP